MLDLIALITIMIWPVVPLFWIPVHGLSKIFKRIGLLTYILPAVSWPPLAYIIYLNRDALLRYKMGFPLFLNITGLVLLIAGTLLHLWTGRLLSLWGLMGLPEVSPKVKGRLVTDGPYSVVRHPTYLAHTLMFSGIFLLTAVAAVGVVTLLDVLVMNAVVIPLEDRELLGRFGREYEEYKKRVPGFFPKLFR